MASLTPKKKRDRKRRRRASVGKARWVWDLVEICPSRPSILVDDQGWVIGAVNCSDIRITYRRRRVA